MYKTYEVLEGCDHISVPWCSPRAGVLPDSDSSLVGLQKEKPPLSSPPALLTPWNYTTQSFVYKIIQPPHPLFLHLHSFPWVYK